MYALTDYPVATFVVSFFLLWAAAQVGVWVSRRWPLKSDKDHEQLAIIVGASLTLLGLVIGFTFSMAVSRYDQRKNLEADEANAIGTEFVRAELLNREQATAVKRLLTCYTDERILFYTSNRTQLPSINATTGRLQNQLWSVVRDAARKATPVSALVATGMNDVLNSQAYTQAAWWNRIPVAAWVLLGIIGLSCTLMLGYNRQGGNITPFIMLPLLIATAFCLIAELDSPRGGFIRVAPQNLIALSEQLRADN